MPSPNGYFDCGASAAIERGWFRATITHDTASPPWDSPNAGSYTFVINVGGTALGPFTPAALTASGNECTPEPDNEISPNGVLNTVIGVGGPGVLTPDADHWLEIILLDPADVEVDRFVCGPTHTLAYPAFNCGTSNITTTGGQVTLSPTSGQVALNAPCDEDDIVWEIATVSGGPYTPLPSEPVSALSPSHTFSALTPDTDYFVRARLSEDSGGEYLVTPECSFSTLAAEPEPPGPGNFQPLPCAAGAGGGGEAAADVEGTLICDVDASGNVQGVALVEAVYDESGARTGTRLVSVLDGTPYVVVGTMQPCQGGCCPEPVELCDLQADGSAVTFIRTYTGQADGGVTAADQLLDGTPYTPTGTVGDCDPYRLCTPSSDQDLNGDCGPGEPANQAIILADGQAPNSTVNDDPTADALCGGSWGPGPDPQPAPFPVTESFRNSTYDEPPFVDQGTPPYPQLTSGGIDAVGDGWLRVSDINSGTNGMHQLVTPFSNADNTTAGVTFAAHDGTSQGGDGLVFALTDGAEPGGQGAAIGGFGNLGLANWEGGYVAVVLDEYGQTCTDSGTGPFAGPGAFCTNSISIQTIGPNRLVQGPAGVIAQAPLAPKFINQTTRSQPAKLITSVITEGGQTYVSASIDWNDGAGPVQYFNRVNVTPVAGPAPATFRMAAYGGSGGGLRDIKEFRDLTAAAGGIQDWRAFPVVTDPIPACVTQVNVTAEVDVTFVSDDQVAGNADNEAWLWLVNTATNTIIDRQELSSLPTQVGTLHHLTVTSGLIPVADLPNIRVYVGAETRDQAGSYGHLWDALDISVSGTGCPVVPRRTLEISAVCPIPVTIVGGGGDGGEAPAPSVFNAPATFEDSEICATIGGVRQAGFRREVRTPDGNIAFSFLGTDGVPITPDTWTPGACACGDTEFLQVCDTGTDPPTPFISRVTYGCEGDIVSAESLTYAGTPYIPVGLPGPCPGSVIADSEILTVCDAGSSTTLNVRYLFDADGNITDTAYFTLDGAGPVVPVGPIAEGGCCEPFDLGESCYDSGGGVIRRVRGQRRCHPDAAPGQDLYFYDTQTGDLVLTPAFVDCPGDDAIAQVDVEQLLLCDATPTRFLRRYTYDAETGAILSVTNTTLDGTTPFVPVGAVGICTTPVATDFDFAEEILCDANGTTFIRRFRFNSQTGLLDTTTNLTLAGAAFVPVGAVGQCSNCCPQVIGSGCTNVGSGFYTAVRSTTGTISLIDSVTGAAVLAANIVACPSDNTARTLTAQARLVTDATPWTPGADVAGTLTSLTVTGVGGLWDMVDSNGTALVGLPAGLSMTWSAEDDNTLTGPQSVTPQAGATVAANWTQR